jgi:hypothetical protein
MKSKYLYLKIILLKFAKITNLFIIKNSRFQARPTTARPGAPRPRISQDGDDSNKNRLNSSNNKSKRNNKRGSDSDDDDFVVKENKFQEDEKQRNFKFEQELKNKRNGNGDLDENENHGALVKKILESKEQLENDLNNRDRNDFVRILEHFNYFLYLLI